MFWTGCEVADPNQGQKTIKMNHRNKIQSLVSPTDDPGDAPVCITESGPCTWNMAISAINRPIFQNKGFPLNPSWIMCRWTLQDRWAPPEHPRDTSHAFSASCCRLPIRPVGTMIDRAASLQPARAPKQQIPLAPCKGRGRFPAHKEDRLCLPSGSVGSILGKATSTTDYWNTVNQTNKQTCPQTPPQV